jgi:hypothetical protein
MITFILITYLVVTVLGSAFLLHGVSRAPVAFEDEMGFHPIVARENAPAEYTGPDRRGGSRRPIRAYRRATD